jgi:adenylate kinase family enzyme
VEKIVILGSAGAGKSTLARMLGPIHHMKVIHLDRLFWGSNWKEQTKYARLEILENFIARGEQKWIIEGNYLHLSEFHVDTADTIIFLDISPLVCFRHLLKRHHEYDRCPRRDIPKGCIDRLTLQRIWKTLTFHFHGRKTIEQTLHKYENKNIVRLYSTKDIEDFLTKQERTTQDKKISYKTVSTNKEKILAYGQYLQPIPFI